MAQPGTVNTPLEGFRVVDLSPDRGAAQVSQTLADFGADVIWVEPPDGSRLRQQPAFPFLGRGKRSVVADLRKEEGVERVRALARSADVMIETFRPGVADRPGPRVRRDGGSQPRTGVHVDHGVRAARAVVEPQRVRGCRRLRARSLRVIRGDEPTGRPPFVTVPWCSFAASHAALQGILVGAVRARGQRAGPVGRDELGAGADDPRGGVVVVVRLSGQPALARRLRRDAVGQRGRRAHAPLRLPAARRPDDGRPVVAVRPESPAPLRGVPAGTRPRVDADRSESGRASRSSRTRSCGSSCSR